MNVNKYWSRDFRSLFITVQSHRF